MSLNIKIFKQALDELGYGYDGYDDDESYDISFFSNKEELKDKISLEFWYTDGEPSILMSYYFGEFDRILLKESEENDLLNFINYHMRSQKAFSGLPVTIMFDYYSRYYSLDCNCDLTHRKFTLEGAKSMLRIFEEHAVLYSKILYDLTQNITPCEEIKSKFINGEFSTQEKTPPLEYEGEYASLAINNYCEALQSFGFLYQKSEMRDDIVTVTANFNVQERDIIVNFKTNTKSECYEQSLYYVPLKYNNTDVSEEQKERKMSDEELYNATMKSKIISDNLDCDNGSFTFEEQNGRLCHTIGSPFAGEELSVEYFRYTLGSALIEINKFN